MLITTVKVTLHVDCSDTAIVFDDAVKAGAGTSVAEQLGHDIKVVAYSDKDWFIREGAICYAEIEKSTSEETVTDDVCPAGA